MKGHAIIFIPAIVLAELYYLNMKFGKPINFSTEYLRLQNSAQFEFVPFFSEDILDFDKDQSIPEMHDRIIVGVARRINAVCLTVDNVIMSSGLVKTTW